MRYRSWQTLLGSYLANFKLLRVLALENTTLGRPSASRIHLGTDMGRLLGSLVYLRYLSLRGSDLETFPWIHKLVLLQTLKLNVHDVINKSPMSTNVLGKFAYLRHLYLPAYYSANLSENFKLRFNGLSKLETLEEFDTKWCEVKDLPKLFCLRRLKLEAVGGYDVKEMFKYLPGIALSSNSCILYLTLTIPMHEQMGFEYDPDMIRQLIWNHKFIFARLSLEGKLPEFSEIFVQEQQLNHTHIDVSLIRITKLRLGYSLLEEDPMPVLEKIPTLRDLSLQFFAYQGKEMVCSAIGFPRLTALNLLYLANLEKWRVEEGSMPVLQHLQIFTCPELEELPEGLIFLHSLHKVMLTDMPLKFCDKVRLENGEQGPDFYKVAHVPDLIVEHPRF
ncbi:putative disease resistance RPP8-like protein 4 [Apium graveolens]|uniref:putative disease resistance RPP8-like protein 4 n=1 Tax=Apium graveolens TaxID=4045 RepID=UPI003D7AAFB1